MKYSLFCIDDQTEIPFSCEEDIWKYVRANKLCIEVIDDEDIPRRRVLDPRYEIHHYSTEGELIALSRLRWETSANWADSDL
ncbi:hypothetical protein V1291_003990 [Nitrobacteraceae bacterium AZCC 1564]